MYIAILGRQPALGMAELEHLYGAKRTQWFSDQTALISTDTFSIEHVGGTQKTGRVMYELPHDDWQRVSMKVVHAYAKRWTGNKGKLTLGISAYGFNVSARDVQKAGIMLKQKLKQTGVSMRLIPNVESALNTATSHHNKLGLSDNKIELIIVRAANQKVIIAESIGAQNITAYARRDQERPRRDAFVGMLPPKLAQTMINLTSSLSSETAKSDVHQAGEHKEQFHILDPFCGTGVILQEGALMGYAVCGTDLSEKMVDFSHANLKWFASSHHLNIDTTIYQGDAMNTKWQQPIDAVVCESYLGQPFSASPSPAKLDQVRKNCDYIISSFLDNIATQLKPGTPLCIGIPAWRGQDNRFTHLPLTNRLQELGYRQHHFIHVNKKDLLYCREDQVVARELLVLTKA